MLFLKLSVDYSIPRHLNWSRTVKHSLAMKKYRSHYAQAIVRQCRESLSQWDRSSLSKEMKQHAEWNARCNAGKLANAYASTKWSLFNGYGPARCIRSYRGARARVFGSNLIRPFVGPMGVLP